MRVGKRELPALSPTASTVPSGFVVTSVRRQRTRTPVLRVPKSMATTTSAPASALPPVAPSFVPAANGQDAAQRLARRVPQLERLRLSRPHRTDRQPLQARPAHPCRVHLYADGRLPRIGGDQIEPFARLNQ